MTKSSAVDAIQQGQGQDLCQGLCCFHSSLTGIAPSTEHVCCNSLTPWHCSANVWCCRSDDSTDAIFDALLNATDDHVLDSFLNEFVVEDSPFLCVSQAACDNARDMLEASATLVTQHILEGNNMLVPLLFADCGLYEVAAPTQDEILQSLAVRGMTSELSLSIGTRVLLFETEHTATFSLYTPLTSCKDVKSQLFNFWNSRSSTAKLCTGVKCVAAPLPGSTSEVYTQKRLGELAHALPVGQTRALFETAASAHVVRPKNRKVQISTIVDVDKFIVTCALAFCACKTDDSFLSSGCKWLLSEDKSPAYQVGLIRAWCCMLGDSIVLSFVFSPICLQD